MKVVLYSYTVVSWIAGPAKSRIPKSTYSTSSNMAHINYIIINFRHLRVVYLKAECKSQSRDLEL